MIEFIYLCKPIEFGRLEIRRGLEKKMAGYSRRSSPDRSWQPRQSRGLTFNQKERTKDSVALMHIARRNNHVAVVDY